ncbi:hypothetical protein PHMEG_00032465 [Phytophthora megakarya]|uniref:Uncharacterized protein n=1 Tax=Phytophthora megakarya TaxID=4795 RepID=A0A225UVK6_9STRA|nr:hypothetical protein PHMEG_00032465 [Phytophthora megakarya]
MDASGFLSSCATYFICSYQTNRSGDRSVGTNGDELCSNGGGRAAMGWVGGRCLQQVVRVQLFLGIREFIHVPFAINACEQDDSGGYKVLVS